MNFNKLTSVAIAVSLVGCSAIEQRDEIYKDSSVVVEQITTTRAEMMQKDVESSSPVREIDGYWLGGKTVKVSRDAELPSIFARRVMFQFPDNPTLSTVGDRIGKITTIPVRITYDALQPISSIGKAQPTAGANLAQMAMPNGMAMPVAGGLIGNKTPTIDDVTSGTAFILDLSSPYYGTVKDLLDQVSARYGVGWDYKDGNIVISRLVTRTYQIASLIDTNEMKSSVVKSSGSSTDSSGGGSESAAQVTSASANSEVSSVIESKLNVVEGVKKSIEATLTPSVGKYSISAFGVVTVTDTREVQAQVEELIDAENRAIGRQIRVRFVMVEVESSNKNDTGFDFTAALAKASKKWNIDLSSPAGMLGGGSSSAGQIGVIRNGNGASTEAFIRAMSEVGRVNLRRDESYTLMNNRPLSVAQVDNFIYPARSTPGYAAGQGSGSGTAGVEPGQLTTGNFLNLRASVLPNGSVIINFNLDASRRGNTETYESNGTVLQYPQSSGGNYQTYASVPNGQTGVIAALDMVNQEAKDRSLDANVNPLFGGGIYNNSVKKAVLILLTPHVIEGAN